MEDLQTVEMTGTVTICHLHLDLLFDERRVLCHKLAILLQHQLLHQLGLTRFRPRTSGFCKRTTTRG